MCTLNCILDRLVETYHPALKPLADLDKLAQPIHESAGAPQGSVPRRLELTGQATSALVDLHDEHLVELLPLSRNTHLGTTGDVDTLERRRQHLGLGTLGEQVSRAVFEERERVGRCFGRCLG